MSDKQRNTNRDKERINQGREADRSPEEGVPANFSGDIRGGGPGGGADLGRGGASTPAGDMAGGGEPRSVVDIGEGTVIARDAVPTGGAGDVARHASGEARQERLSEQPIESQRTALDGAPGIPAGSGADLEEVLRTPDSELGGAIAGDTTPSGPTGDEPDERQVREDDRKRNTL